ncbi:cold-responsive protein kinase 1-like isoform X1 [Salvia splendens]|uniref:cold-responsive protein kinase 1-like isoform X1 n=1 Tax=Salvia splendens TaxID=180675 RepID=UPI001C2554C3|nr:cold-responsive protein kinase 1-like isoform X1 [Salvia splendens]XP_042020572.1 cold-responsive protein kinase 1-like isoform X1 [Salvia splendens]XP_042020573.1 cold-responsive protein kinase 1-like isoform X1 [Salvia splendens]XP_042020574.1 cold-responsive protein kinase 1-like isoform X1 [Salvia splendens]
MLLYEFMGNGSLDSKKNDVVGFIWSDRFKVIIGIAKGVIYLRQEASQKMIYRNHNPTIKLLDNEMNPKISGFGFGLAKIIEDGHTQVSTRRPRTIMIYVSFLSPEQRYFVSLICVCRGYFSPVFYIRDQVSEMSDVYSFGVYVLEILSGKRYSNRERENLIGSALGKNRNVLAMVDAYLGGYFSAEEALRCIQVCLLCTQYDPQQRPTMASALRMLLGEHLRLQEKMEQAQRLSNFATSCSYHVSSTPSNCERSQ